MATMTRTQGQPGASVPPILNDKRFRNGIQEYLVTLEPQSAGLGVLVTGAENAVVVFPRGGRNLTTLDEFLELKWVKVTVDSLGDGPSLHFVDITSEEAGKFLRSIKLAS